MRTALVARLCPRSRWLGCTSENIARTKDQRLCEVWTGHVYYQYFCGEEFFQHKLVFDRSSMTRSGGREWARKNLRRFCKKALALR